MQSTTQPSLDGEKGSQERVLRRLEGPGVKLANFAGKNVILVFGSYSDPSFRDKAAGLAALLKRIGRRAEVLVVYSAELFPGGGIRRNEDAGVNLRQHRTIEDRIAAAKKASVDLKLGGLVWTVDSMDGSVAGSFGLNYPTPAAAVVVDRDGKVVRVSKYLDVYAVEDAVMNLPGRGASTRPIMTGEEPATTQASDETSGR